MPKEKGEAKLIAVMKRLCDNPGARLVADEEGRCKLSGPGAGRKAELPAELVRELVSRGLLQRAEPGRFTAGASAQSWLKRQDNPDLPFRAQHHLVETAALPGEAAARVLVNREESPIAALARRAGQNGETWLAPPAVTAAERLRRDFELGGLQPRITANWSASVATGRRSGDASGIADLTDVALAARIRFDRALDAVGPELSGILVDICCFLKGLEQVERERRWPARSAKLVLKLALEALARHYGLAEIAVGAGRRGRVRHWGAEDYRPAIV